MTPCTLAVWRRRRSWKRRGGCRSRCWWCQAGRWSWVSSKRRWWTRSTLTWRSLSLLWNVIFIIMIIIIGQGRHWPGGVRPRPRPRDTRLAWVLEVEKEEIVSWEFLTKIKMVVIRKGRTMRVLWSPLPAPGQGQGQGLSSLYLSKGLLGGVRVRGWGEGLSPGLLITS